MKDIKLEEGEIICDNCHGKSKSFGESVTVCMKCWGAGKLDWIEACVGKAPPRSVFVMKNSISKVNGKRNTFNTTHDFR